MTYLTTNPLGADLDRNCEPDPEGVKYRTYFIKIIGKMDDFGVFAANITLTKRPLSFGSQDSRARSKRNFMLYTKIEIFLLGFALALSPISNSFAANKPDMTSKRLSPCPDSPNCVSSQAVKNNQFVQPISFEGPADQAFNRLERAIRALPGSRIIVREDTYMHAEFQTKWLRFIDDVESILDAENNIIHIRSASRTGYSDFGANRKRVESIRSQYIQSLSSDDGLAEFSK